MIPTAPCSPTPKRTHHDHKRNDTRDASRTRRVSIPSAREGLGSSPPTATDRQPRPLSRLLPPKGAKPARLASTSYVRTRSSSCSTTLRRPSADSTSPSTTPGISGRIGPLHEFDLDEWERIQEVDLRGVFLCMRAGLAQMTASGGGSIVNTSSVAGRGQARCRRPHPHRCRKSVGGPVDAAARCHDGAHLGPERAILQNAQRKARSVQSGPRVGCNLHCFSSAQAKLRTVTGRRRVRERPRQTPGESGLSDMYCVDARRVGAPGSGVWGQAPRTTPTARSTSVS